MAQIFGISLCILFCFPVLLCSEVDKKVHYNSPSVVDKVDVGVILEMGSREAKLLLSCISMALSDFYNLHNDYSTRVVLHSRDSHGKALHALSAALSLLDNIKVEAIISAEPRMQADLLEELGVEVPVLSLSQPILSPPLTHRYPFFIEITQDETSQVMGIASLIETYKWKDVIVLYESTKYARDIISSFTSSFQEKNIYVSYKSSISASSTNQQILEELQKLMTLKTRVIVVHMSHVLMPRLFLNAKKLGMMREYAWIMTSASMNFLQSMDTSVIASMQGVVGFKSYIPASTSLNEFTSRIRRKFYSEEPDMELVRESSADGIWAYDATWALADAVERTRIKSSTTGSSKHGVVLLGEILQTRLKGLSGEVRYPNGNLKSSGFEIVNIMGSGMRRVGFWPDEQGKITQESPPLSNMRNALPTNLETIIWPRGSSTIMKRSKRRLSGIKLRVGVPVKKGFKELVRVEHDEQTNRTHVTGFCIDVFETAIRGLPYKVHYEFIPFVNANGQSAGSYNDLVYKVYLKTYDAVAGDTTITSNRSLYVDFTVPFTDVGVGILVPNEKENMWVFLEPLSGNLWITTAGFFILTGFVVWLIERPVNQEFQGSTSQQLGTIFWFSFSTLVFSHREKLSNNLAKFVTIIWVFVVFILTSSYTATLASLMTVKQINVNSRGNYIADLTDFERPQYKRYHTVEEFADGLSRGSKHGGVSAIIEEIPYLKIFLAKYSADYSMIKPKLTTNGFGFVFPKGSKLGRDMSRQIEILREEGKLLEMEKAWFQISDAVSSSNPGTLNLSSFRGLFLVTGVSSAAALLLFFISSLKDKWHVVKICTVISLSRGQLMQRIRNHYLTKCPMQMNTQVHR